MSGHTPYTELAWELVTDREGRQWLAVTTREGLWRRLPVPPGFTTRVPAGMRFVVYQEDGSAHVYAEPMHVGDPARR